jgi:flagellar motor switch protein FliM
VPAARVFDFREPLPMPAGATGLVAAAEAAAPRVGLLLGLSLGRPLPVRCSSVRRVALVEVATPGAVWGPLACGLADSGALLVPAATAVALADVVLGGPGTPEDRPPSVLEQQLLVQHLVPALRPLAEALAEHGVTGLSCPQLSDRPLPVGAGEVVAVSLEVRLPADDPAPLTVCLPAKSLLPTDAEPPAPRPEHAAEQALAGVPVEVALRLCASTVSADVVEDLHPGDVIRLDPDALSGLVGVLGAGDAVVPVLTASLGRRGRRRAVLVTAPHGGA